MLTPYIENPASNARLRIIAIAVCTMVGFSPSPPAPLLIRICAPAPIIVQQTTRRNERRCCAGSVVDTDSSITEGIDFYRTNHGYLYQSSEFLRGNPRQWRGSVPSRWFSPGERCSESYPHRHSS